MGWVSSLLERFASGERDGGSVALSAYDPQLPRDATALVRSMRSIDPASARDRIKQRMIYAGAAANRLTEDFVYNLRSPDMEIRQDLRNLRSRARQLSRDNPHARQFLRALQVNVIGPKGVRLRARHVTTESTAETPVPHTRANKAIEVGWKDFGRKENAIASKDMTLDEVGGLGLKNLAVDGEIFVHRLRGFKNGHGYTLDLIDPDQFDETYFRYAFTDNDTEVRMGIEINRWGEAIAFWPWKRHPSEYAQQIRVRIPATDILHVFIRERPRQTRGVTWFAPVLTNTQMYSGYQTAELVASRQGASTSAFLETDPTKGGQYTLPSEPDASEDLEDQGVVWPGEPGTVPELAPGQSIKFWKPDHPTTAYEAFSRQILMSIAAGIGVSYAALTGDLSRANYSSLREGKLSERDAYELIQQFFTDHFYRPVYGDWLPMALAAGAISLPTNDVERWQDVQFLPRGWDWVDPWKDLQASSLEVAMGLTSRTRLCAQRGYDFEEVVAEMAQDQEIAEKYGVILSLDTRLTMTPGAGGSDDTDVKPGEADPGPAGEGGGGDGGDGGRALVAPHLRLARASA